MVIGNKIDQKTEGSDAIIEKAKLWCEKKNFQHFESSAKEGSNVESIFKLIANTLMISHPRVVDNLYDETTVNLKDENEIKDTHLNVRNNNNQQNQNEKGGCCG